MRRTGYPPAYWEGVEAASDGEPITANPYAADDLDDPAAARMDELERVKREEDYQHL